jgi:hypothetical protein
MSWPTQGPDLMNSHLASTVSCEMHAACFAILDSSLQAPAVLPSPTSPILNTIEAYTPPFSILLN